MLSVSVYQVMRQILSLFILLELEEIPSICWCGKRAQFNARIRDGKIIRHGEQIMIDGNEEYVPTLCTGDAFSKRLNNQLYIFKKVVLSMRAAFSYGNNNRME